MMATELRFVLHIEVYALRSAERELSGGRTPMPALLMSTSRGTRCQSSRIHTNGAVKKSKAEKGVGEYLLAIASLPSNLPYLVSTCFTALMM